MISGNYKGKYIGRTMCGFIHGFEYEFELNNNGRTYQLNAYKDNTLDKAVDLSIAYASENSINKNWELLNN